MAIIVFTIGVVFSFIMAYLIYKEINTEKNTVGGKIWPIMLFSEFIFIAIASNEINIGFVLILAVVSNLIGSGLSITIFNLKDNKNQKYTEESIAKLSKSEEALQDKYLKALNARQKLQNRLLTTGDFVARQEMERTIEYLTKLANSYYDMKTQVVAKRSQLEMDFDADIVPEIAYDTEKQTARIKKKYNTFKNANENISNEIDDIMRKYV